MKPLVILDTNVFYGSRPLLAQKVRHLLALSSRDKIRLVIPETVLLEVSRQWVKEYEKNMSNLQASLEGLKGLMGSIGELPPSLMGIVPETRRAEAFQKLKEQLIAARAEVPRRPDILLDEIIERDLSAQKPFSDGGKGLRDFLIWRTAVESIAEHTNKGSVIFVTSNTSDFASPDKKSVHSDLLKDLHAPREITYVTNLKELMALPEIAGLASQELWLHSPVDGLDVAQIIANAELKLDILSGKEVASAVGDYDYELGWSHPLSTALENPSIVGFDLAPDPVITTFKTDKDDVTGIQVQFDAECHVDGYISKSDYYMDDHNEIGVIETDWNNYMMLAEQYVQVRVIFSGEYPGEDKSNIDLQLEEVIDLAVMDLTRDPGEESGIHELSQPHDNFLR